MIAASPRKLTLRKQCGWRAATTALPARAMLSLAHFKFTHLVNYKMRCASGIAYEVKEAYISKTCSRCGSLKTNLDGAVVFNCDDCGTKVDRDVNAARKISLLNRDQLKSIEIIVSSGATDVAAPGC